MEWKRSTDWHHLCFAINFFFVHHQFICEKTIRQLLNRLHCIQFMVCSFAYFEYNISLKILAHKFSLWEYWVFWTRKISASAKSSYLRKTSSFAITIFRSRRRCCRALRASMEQEKGRQREEKRSINLDLVTQPIVIIKLSAVRCRIQLVACKQRLFRMSVNSLAI